ncbi:putative carbohydrate/purine kinase, PfkB, carbohydrate kinase PfkB, ribokinase, inositol 3-kinase [Helianthus annuus]|uniref:Carbohydrate kinase PfkB, ribokinase, inositol 3-kinase n=1 Tax=Helianthus annuus TaxID=4232 RepID=A0A251UZU8_HELAN|nr:inositol 3-kinase [Helianthus annuus]KAF5809737.1 putative carbohydrate kinase PfkB, ribokinase, inositol 3-kinase [Helianthus annuus]KAJ0580709.1 putative carbohydrate/purine kinase, PfkB, carbohydrate kinase PfkB, ribokinase, inositol 3-kinase [Helianthus annuus]KAJ0588362.1 putative carbohydrate/purine kinase, PfkB, carbohydrate kinase PfkB, ribokinase, inositol 3-kinase [Helianthus annuus]KAJ0596659.1 putative carbohydrate/purine kinase, PfkB, carbohydrate kinase PfkB, ribokinase, inosit
MVANQPPHGLIVGNYCHDVLIKNNAVLAETLGGAAAFISAVLDGLHLPFTYVTKAGSDFAYTTTVNHPPIIAGKTAVFHAYFDSDPADIRGEDRILKRIRSSDPISPSDLPDDDVRFGFGLAVGVAGEIVPETLEKMVELCDVVLVDVQALIRVFDESDGTVKLVSLKETGFNRLVSRIGFLKASAEEVPYVDVDEVRKSCCVVVTGGEEGCTVYWKDGEVRIPAFSSVQVDPTGAGDSFLGGLVAGLVEGLAVPDAAVLGNFFGSLTVEQIGLPEFDVRLMQKVKDEVHARKMQRDGHDDESRFTKTSGHEQFIASLVAAKLIKTQTVSPNHVLDPDMRYTDVIS